MTLTPDLRPDAPEDDTLTGQSYAAGRAELADQAAARAVRASAQAASRAAASADAATLVSPTVSLGMKLVFTIFLGVPFLALLLAIPVAWGGWLSWVDVGLALVFYVITAMGITVGYHRHFTHGSFKARRWVRIMLVSFGSMAVEGSVAQWVADHRKHHAFSDADGDPHSPWRFGTSTRAVAKGLWFAHVGWLFSTEQSPVERYAPDVAADPDLRTASKFFPALVGASFLLPALLGGLITWSWLGALTAFFWAGLVRITLVHQVTWSINSVCHVWGSKPFKSRDKSGNVAWLAIPAFGESWHNLHHAEPTAARHGVLKGQVDLSALLIRFLERLRLVSDVRWPKPERLAAKVSDPAVRSRIRGYRPPQGQAA